MTNLLTQLRDALALSAKATPEKWERHNAPYDDEPSGWIDTVNGVAVLEYRGCGSHEASWNNPADMELALAAVNLLRNPELLATLERAEQLEAELAGVREDAAMLDWLDANPRVIIRSGKQHVRPLIRQAMLGGE